MLKDSYTARSFKASVLVKDINNEFIKTASAPIAYLPSERELAEKYHVARTTVRRALNMLAEKNLIKAEQGRGYRILSVLDGLRRNSPIAFLVPSLSEQWRSEWMRDELGDAVRAILKDRGWHVLYLTRGKSTPKELVDRIKKADAWGVILGSDDEDIYNEVAKSKIPCIALEWAGQNIAFDSIQQDNFGGAALAAEYLINKGHKEITWLGRIEGSDHSIQRYAGAYSVLRKNHLSFIREYTLDEEDNIYDELTDVLLKKPKAILCLWSNMTKKLKVVADKLGVNLTKDIDLVSWSVEHNYKRDIVDIFSPGIPPPTITWSIDTMAQITVNRLLWQMREPELVRNMKIVVPGYLKMPKV